ncbi:hypothetical protein PsorP6_007192 [Peronosclerospora sorghi]|uniref:Uncharacterized protein n=1 Tax=Peronosclerospora sorghi TaxID=230839 RepID=A0ACC0WBB9_9STRA|nr:hypothetical protein PsorP6_007192 [Peronosclerospora sorghi]
MAFDGSVSMVSTCPTGSNRSGELGLEAGAESFSSSLRSSCLSFASRRLRRIRRRSSQARVPLISVTWLYNHIQTSGVILVDCCKTEDFSSGHLPDALHFPHVHTGSHLSALSCAGQVAKTVDDVLDLSEKRPVDPATNFVRFASLLLEEPEFRIPGAECLEVYMTRSFGKGHRTIMMQSIGQILEKVDTLDLTTLEQDLSASLCFHKKINDLLIAWGTCQLDALMIETPSEEDMALLGGISRNFFLKVKRRSSCA